MDKKQDLDIVEISQLSNKSLRKLAKKHKVKNYKKKTPASLRRALRRLKKKPKKQETKLKSKSFEAAVDAYRERRLRYLFSPSKFVHSGVHDEFILENEEELDFTEWYGLDEMVTMPIDPYQFYAYWDFSEQTHALVENLYPQIPFVLRVYDISDIAFDGSNAHNYWDEVCHPLIKEWYLNNLPVSGRNVCIELGYLKQSQFIPILRSNTIAIPPEGVSAVVSDMFGQYLPTIPEPRPEVGTLPGEKQIEKLEPPPLPSKESIPDSQKIPPLPKKMGELFFQPYQPPQQKERGAIDSQEWNPEIKAIEQTIDEDMIPNLPKLSPHPPAPQPLPEQIQNFHPMQQVYEPETHEGFNQSTFQWAPKDLDISPKEYFEQFSFAQNIQLPEYEEYDRWVSSEWIDQGGVIWHIEGPEYISPYYFFEELDSPHDQMTAVSLNLFPWEWEEYVPLGSSDWTMRKFLGASPSSWWFRPPGASERRWRLKPPGASERRWRLKPPGASERRWRLKPPGASERRWRLKPPGASERQVINWSGRGRA